MFYSSPLKSNNIFLDFNSVDEDGNAIMAEGKLKQQVMVRQTHGKTYLIGSNEEVKRVCRMAGVGRTEVMKILREDRDIRKAFRDGVYFFLFGEDVAENMLIEKIRKCVADFGGRKEMKEMVRRN